MFHWAVESIREEGYFTEKLLDCFMTYTIPVYYGDPKIGNVFNLDGIIMLDTADPVGQANSLTESLYEYKIYAIMENHKLALPYCNILNNIHNVLRAIS